MGQQIIVDTDYLLDTTKSISDTSSEISKSILTLQKLSNEISTFINDESMNNFKISFSNYVSVLGNIPSFFENVTNNINTLAKEYDESDNSDNCKESHCQIYESDCSQSSCCFRVRHQKFLRQFHVGINFKQILNCRSGYNG